VGKLFLIARALRYRERRARHQKWRIVVKGVARSLKLPYIFKASYDKANRTSIGSYRGPGIAEGCGFYVQGSAAGRRACAHGPWHEIADVDRVAETVDVIQIPAFLSRQNGSTPKKPRRTGRP